MSSSPPRSCSRCGASCERPANFCPVCGYPLQDVSPTISVFFSYAHRDKMLRDRLEDHLSNLKYRGLITTWYDREIRAGEEWA